MTSLKPELVRSAPSLSRPVIFDQQWLQLTFLHWRVATAAVAPFFPPGTRPDVIDGVSYVGLVPFRMHHAGPGPSLPVPYFGSFGETNVRLYSIDDQGRRGILFRSLETQRLAIVGLTKSLLGLPYTWSQMSITRYRDLLTYQSRRRWPQRGLSSVITIRIGEHVEPTPLEEWLTARWGLHTRVAGRTVWIPNAHPAWPLHAAELVELSDDLVQAAGIIIDGSMLRPLYSPGVQTRFGRPVLLA